MTEFRKNLSPKKGSTAMETGDSHFVDPHQVIALIHRITMLSAMRKVTIVGFFIFLLLAITQRSWWLILVSVVTAWITSIVMSVVSANKVQKLTGMSHEYQATIWERYKHDPEFAAAVHKAIELRRIN